MNADAYDAIRRDVLARVERRRLRPEADLDEVRIPAEDVVVDHLVRDRGDVGRRREPFTVPIQQGKNRVEPHLLGPGVIAHLQQHVPPGRQLVGEQLAQRPVGLRLQVALALAPVLVLLSLVIGPQPMTLVIQPLLIGALALTGLLAALITLDGRSTWLEGLALMGLYVIVAASVFWVAPIRA